MTEFEYLVERESCPIETVTLIYFEYENIIRDENDEIVYDIFKIITPSQLMMYKKKRGIFYVQDKEDPWLEYELIFPVEGEEEEYYCM